MFLTFQKKFYTTTVYLHHDYYSLHQDHYRLLSILQKISYPHHVLDQLPRSRAAARGGCHVLLVYKTLVAHEGVHRVRLATAVSGLVLDCVRDKV